MTAPFLALDGWTIPCANEQGSILPQEIGRDVGRGVSMALRATRRGMKRLWTLKTIAMVQADAVALKKQIEGVGWHFNFDQGLYSARTLVGPTSDGYTATTGTTSPAPVYGTRRILVPSGTTLNYPLALSATDGWCVQAWVYNATNPTWALWTRISDGSVNGATQRCYKNGVLQGSTTAPFALTVDGSGNVVLTGNRNTAVTAGDCYFDDMVVHTWTPTAAQITAWAAMTTAFGDVPMMLATGRMLSLYTDSTSVGVNVIGAVTGIDFETGNLDNTSILPNGQIISFTLEEV